MSPGSEVTESRCKFKFISDVSRHERSWEFKLSDTNSWCKVSDTHSGCKFRRTSSLSRHERSGDVSLFFNLLFRSFRGAAQYGTAKSVIMVTRGCSSKTSVRHQSARAPGSASVTQRSKGGQSCFIHRRGRLGAQGQHPGQEASPVADSGIHTTQG